MKTYRILWANDTTPVIANGIVSLDLGNYQFTIARSDERALDLLDAETFDLVIANLSVSDMDGLAILREAKQPAPGITTIALVEPGNIRALIDALRLGVDDFLFVPYKIEEVLYKVFNSLNTMGRWHEAADRKEILTICCDCKKVKVVRHQEFDYSKWMSMENFLQEKMRINTTSTYCPSCVEKVRHEMDLLTSGKPIDNHQNV